MTSYIYDMVDTWNAGATTFTAVKMNVTDTASASGSLLMDLQVGGSSKFSVGKTGVTTGLEYRVSNSPSTRFRSDGVRTLITGHQGDQYGFYFGVINEARFGLVWSSANDVTSTPDLFLTRRAAANLRLGAADAAAPVAQTLSVQSVVAGTTDTAGANLTITGSQGTGTGAGGSIIFQVAPAGTAGTAQNALATALTITSNKIATFADRVVATGLWVSSANANGITFSGSSMLFYAGSAAISRINSSGLNLEGANYAFSISSDTILARDAANTLALRNGTNAQESRVYGSYTSATNFQRMSIKTLRESSGALSGASYTTTIAIPAYANLIGVTTRVTTEVTGATTYDVGDGTDVDLWGAAIGVALGSQSRTADFTAVGAVGAAATSRTVTLTANGSNFTGGVVEICLHYLTTEAD